MTAAVARKAEPRLLTIREAAAATGVTAHTLRYYERIGLALPVGRARRGHRRYSEDDVRWVVFLRRLHATGMPIRKMLEYARLARKGDAGSAARRQLLEGHRAEMLAQLAQLTSTLKVIDQKLALYDCGSGAHLRSTGERSDPREG